MDTIDIKNLLGFLELLYQNGITSRAISNYLGESAVTREPGAVSTKIDQDQLKISEKLIS